MEREEKAFWCRHTPAADRDVVHLCPATSSKALRFETITDAGEISEMREQRLRMNNPAVAQVLQDCRSGRYTCAHPYCPICAREYRRWLVGQLLEAKVRAPKRARIVTVFLGRASLGKLSTISIRSAHAALRQRLHRNALQGTMVAGGTEVSYHAQDGTWLIHVHLLVLGARAEEIEALRTVAARGANRPVKVQPVKNTPKQLSYLQKFNTFHRPGEQRGARRPRAFPLPDAAYFELVRWFATHRFEDFLFLYGAHRRGSRIVRTQRPYRGSISEKHRDAAGRRESSAKATRR